MFKINNNMNLLPFGEYFRMENLSKFLKTKIIL